MDLTYSRRLRMSPNAVRLSFASPTAGLGASNFPSIIFIGSAFWKEANQTKGPIKEVSFVSGSFVWFRRNFSQMSIENQVFTQLDQVLVAEKLIFHRFDCFSSAFIEHFNEKSSKLHNRKAVTKVWKYWWAKQNSLNLLLLLSLHVNESPSLYLSSSSSL